MSKGPWKKNKKEDVAELEKPGAAEAPEKANEEDEVRAWNGAIEATLRWRQEKERKYHWDSFVKEFRGDWGHVQDTVSIPLPPINYVFSYVKTEIARLYFRDPWITVNAKKLEDLGKAEIAEQLVNYVWGELNLKQEIKLALRDALLVGHGWIKLGYSAEFGTVESQPKEGAGSSKEVMPSEYIKSENVFAYYVPWKDVLFSTDSLRPPHDARWMAFKIVKPLRAVKESGIYENTDDLEPSNDPREEQENNLKAVSTVTLWEIWDRDHRKVYTVAKGHEKYLREIDWPYDMDGFPAVMFYFNPLPDECYPLSDISVQEPQIIELMKMNAIMVNHLKRWNRQVFYKAGLFTELEKEKFKLGVDGAMIETQGNPATDFFIPPYAAVQQDVYGIWGLTLDILRNVCAQTEQDRGAVAKTNTRTLGELRMAQQGGRSRSDERLDMLEDQINELAKKLLTIMRQKLTLPKIVRIVGQRAVQDAQTKAQLQRPSMPMMGQPPMGQPGQPSLMNAIQARPSANEPNSFAGAQAFTMTGVDIPDQLDVDTVAGSTIPLNKENKLKLMNDFMKVGQFFGLLPGSKAARELGKYILREIEIKELDRVMDIAEEEAQAMQQQGASAGPPGQPGAREKMQSEQLHLESEKLRHASTVAQTQATVVQAQTQKQLAEMKIREQILKHMLEAQRVQNGVATGSPNGGM